MFKIDASTSVLADDDLELVVPSVGAGADLHAFSYLACTAEHVHAKLRCVHWLGVIQAKDEQCAINNIQAIAVVGAFVFAQNFAKTGPDLTILGTQDAQSSFGCVLCGSLFGIIDDSLEIQAHVSLCHDEIAVLVHDIEPVELTFTQDHNVFTGRILANVASVVCGNSSRTEKTRVLIHA